MRSRTYIKGDKELQLMLKTLQKNGSGAQLAPAVDAGLLVIQNEIVENAPYKTGNYKRSWHLGEARTTSTSAYNTTGSDVVYGARLEFGFEDTDSLGRSYQQAAQPHVRPAFDNKREAAIKEVTDALAAILAAGL